MRVVVNLFGDAHKTNHIYPIYTQGRLPVRKFDIQRIASGSEYAIGFSFPSATFQEGFWHSPLGNLIYSDKAVTILQKGRYMLYIGRMGVVDC
jgi:hypothetical protein